MEVNSSRFRKELLSVDLLLNWYWAHAELFNQLLFYQSFYSLQLFIFFEQKSYNFAHHCIICYTTVVLVQIFDIL